MLTWAASVPSTGAKLTHYQVLVDGHRVATVSASVRKLSLTVRPGARTIAVAAVDPAGKKHSSSVRITVR